MNNELRRGDEWNETENMSQYCRLIPDCYSNSGQLCNECNVNQEIKIKLLSAFIPFNENNFSQECDEYKKYLEMEYKLCTNCENKLSGILSKPINCYKELTTNRSPVKTLNANDSVFLRQKCKRVENGLIFIVINMLETVSLVCAVVLFIIGVIQLQYTTELTLIEIPLTLNQLLSTYFSQPLLLIVTGFSVSFIAINICGKELLYVTNVFSQVLWIVFLLINIPLFEKNIHKRDLTLLKPILCVFLIILSVINTCIRMFVVIGKRNTKQSSLTGHKKSSQTLSHNWNVCSNGTQKINRENDISGNVSADQVIRKQIKALCIFDDSDNKPIKINEIPEDRESMSAFKSTLRYANSIILPAKFKPESIAQTSWVSPFKQCPRKESLNSTLFGNSHRFASSSHWINHSMTGLVTPPPSAPASISSESAFAYRQPFINTTNSLPHFLDHQRNSFYNYSDSCLRTRFIGQYRTDSTGKSSRETSVSGSLSTLTIDKTSNQYLTQNETNRSFSANLTQTFVFAVFLLILFCFVIFLSLPVVFKSTCDFNSMNFHFTVESVPQNNFCIK